MRTMRVCHARSTPDSAQRAPVLVSTNDNAKVIFYDNDAATQRHYFARADIQSVDVAIHATAPIPPARDIRPRTQQYRHKSVFALHGACVDRGERALAGVGKLPSSVCTGIGPAAHEPPRKADRAGAYR